MRVRSDSESRANPRAHTQVQVFGSILNLNLKCGPRSPVERTGTQHIPSSDDRTVIRKYTAETVRRPLRNVDGPMAARHKAQPEGKSDACRMGPS